MTGHCRDCKYWRHVRDGDYEEWRGPHGECNRIDDASFDEPAWIGVIAAALSDDGQSWVPVPFEGEASLITQPDFGCGLFEAKA